MASEGSREIEAARQRLAAAKSQAESAAKMMEHAKAMWEAAEKEVDAAKTGLKDAEKRWEVIDLDSDADEVEDASEAESRKKRRKVSLSPGGERIDDISEKNSNNGGIDVRHGDGSSVDAAAEQPRRTDSGSTFLESRREEEERNKKVQEEQDQSRKKLQQEQEQRKELERRKMQEERARAQAAANHKAQQLSSRELEFRAAVKKHRDDTLRLLKLSAAKGESSVPLNKMAETRSKNLAKLKAANILVQKTGGKGIGENGLTTVIAMCESKAVQLYVQEMAKMKEMKNSLAQQQHAVCQNDGPAAGATSHQSRRSSDARRDETSGSTIKISIPASISEYDLWGNSIAGINGSYKQSRLKYGGAFRYSKRGKWAGGGVTFTLSRWEKQWRISVPGGEPIFADSSNPNNNPYKPPQTGWSRIRVENVTVEGCGVSQVNGNYKPITRKEAGAIKAILHDGVPMFTKVDSGGDPGVQAGSFTLSRTERNGKKWWLIGPSAGGPSLYKLSCNQESLEPPANGWQANNEGDGPAPRLKFLYTGS